MVRSEFVSQPDGEVGLVELVDKDILSLDVEVEPSREIHLESGSGIDTEFVDGVGELFIALQGIASPTLKGDTCQRIEREAAGKGDEVVHVAIDVELVAVVIGEGIVDRGGYPPMFGDGQMYEDAGMDILAIKQVTRRYTQTFGVVGLGLGPVDAEQYG